MNKTKIDESSRSRKKESIINIYNKIKSERSYSRLTVKLSNLLFFYIL
jgi:hypothetical protein